MTTVLYFLFTGDLKLIFLNAYSQLRSALASFIWPVKDLHLKHVVKKMFNWLDNRH